MKFVSWNIQQGGGTRADRIIRQIEFWQPDVVGMCEFQDTDPSRRIADGLAELGLIHQATTIDAAERGRNFVFLASRRPFERQGHTGLLDHAGRWLHVEIQGMKVIVMGVPIRSGGNKFLFHDAVIGAFDAMADSPAIAFGDTNTGEQGLDEECSYFTKRESDWFSRIRNSGWVDVWRQRNPDSREFTWFSDHGNGFRIDQVFATQSVEPDVVDVQYDWGEAGRESRLSDHAAIVFELKV